MKTVLSLLVVLFALVHTSAFAESHALIMTIGEYTNGVPRLQGPKFDVASARAIARKMGVKDANMRFYKDAELTVDGFRKAFNDLFDRVGDNDQVFVYYSGHGSRWHVTQPDDRCAVSLVAVDGSGFMDTDMDAELRRLAAKAQKIVVFLDACHSGGLKTRAITQAPAGWAPKFYSKDGPNSCETPVNYIARALTTQSRSIGKGINNYVFVAAARENEVSWDSGSKGGVATQAWRDCITGAAKDHDGSGGLSAEEIASCAQEKIDSMLKGLDSRGILPNHVSIAGNAKAVLAFPEKTVPPPAASTPIAAPAVTTPAPSALVVPPAVTTAPPAAVVPPAVTTAPPAAVVPPVVTAAPPAAVVPPAIAATSPAPSHPAQTALPAAYYTLSDIYNNRDDRRVVTLQSPQPTFKVGSDNIGFTLTSNQPGYVYLLMVGTDGKTFDVLFPNQIDGNNQVRGDETIKLPHASWSIKAGGPAGKNYLLAVVADAPRDFSKLGMQPAGPFSMLAANTTSSKDIQLVTATSSQSTTAECQEPSIKRSLVVQKRCSNAYGAAMMVIEEAN